MRTKPGSWSSALLLSTFASLAAVLGAGSAEAKPVAPASGMSEPPVRRTAARALDRSLSTQWLLDVDSRIQLLLERIADQPAQPRETRTSEGAAEIRR